MTETIFIFLCEANSSFLDSHRFTFYATYLTNEIEVVKLLGIYEQLFIYQNIMMQVDTTLTAAMDEVTAAQIAELFNALSDTSRVRIVAVLAGGKMNVGELADLVGISHSAVSHHLRHLRQMRLVRAHKDGRHVYYTLDDAHVRDLFRCGLEHVQHG
jgi:DNA-binding transcriptional ArsR family regulator